MDHGGVYVYFCNWIKAPHDKIGLCLCNVKSFCFWFNSDAAFHGHGQLAVAAGEHQAITKDCFLDLSRVCAMSAQEVAAAQARGLVSDQLKGRILVTLQNPIKTLPEVHRALALTNLA